MATKKDSRLESLIMDGTAPAPNSAVFGRESSMSVGDGKAGVDADGVQRNAIGLESTAGMRHVSKEWQEHCQKFTSFQAQIKSDAARKTDEVRPEAEVRLDSSLRLPDGLSFTQFGLSTLVSKYTGVPMAMVDFLVNNSESHPEYAGQLADYINNSLDERNSDYQNHVYKSGSSRAEKGKERTFLLRKRFEGDQEVVRMVGSERYGVADNDLMLDLLAESLPSKGIDLALASHVYNNGDDINGNILIPDMMKSRPDSDYGVGIAFRNSEVGKYTFQVTPFLFRAICKNGCIWGLRESEMRVNKKHLGTIDMWDLRNQVKKAVEIALTEGNCLLNNMEMAQQVKVAKGDIGKIIAYLAKQNKLTVEQGRAWFQDFHIEPFENAFGVINSLTRAAQRYNGDTRFELEAVAGEILSPKLQTSVNDMEKRWAQIIDRSSDLSKKAVEQIAVLQS